ncbi:class I SAM-dependent methyltransferase [Paenibacillus alvei]|uniref:class I SAM-dependent methyltransferase n=1 Tax=Paenibacillus alvei TaxID=44250 RepID=UPI001656EBC2|nr:class I SAM-dependent methyltransferase [Paenibacillus alvei]MBG9736811.1 family 2 glycosyl transferase [Paenibacillus alvei]MBG9746967.1 family 2 glycosyl transferase [Paenibacillus alvei]
MIVIHFWNGIIHPILRLTQPRTIVEIGCAQGYNTMNLLSFASTVEGGRLIAIDPSPLFDVEQLIQQFGDRFDMRRGLSLDILPHILSCDAAFIDGDHNWYTVYHELKHFERMERFPIIFLHDLEWPYGRRDMYYFPESIPAEYRKPSAMKGILPGVSELVENGHNSSVHNAEYEYGEKNGVLTAVEDFIAQSSLPLELHRAHSQFGLGIIIPYVRGINFHLNEIVKRIISHSNL